MRISVTTIESYRLFVEPDQEWMSEDELLATIRGEFVPNRAVRIGSAFDSVLTHPKRFAVAGGYQCEGFTFDGAEMQPALDLFDRLGVFQVKAEKAYGPHVVVAKADQMIGTRLIENKTTLSTFNFDKYAASCQWRFYGDMFEPSRITYNVFGLADDYADAGEGDEPSPIRLKSIDSFDLYPYAEMHDDCVRLVHEFASYVERKGLAHILNARQEAA